MKPSTAPGYLDKYRASIEGELQTTVEQIDATYDTEIRISRRPCHVVAPIQHSPDRWTAPPLPAAGFSARTRSYIGSATLRANGRRRHAS